MAWIGAGVTSLTHSAYERISGRLALTRLSESADSSAVDELRSKLRQVARWVTGLAIADLGLLVITFVFASNFSFLPTIATGELLVGLVVASVLFWLAVAWLPDSSTAPDAGGDPSRPSYEVRFDGRMQETFDDRNLAVQWAAEVAGTGRIVDVVMRHRLLPPKLLTAFPESERAARDAAWERPVIDSSPDLALFLRADLA
jgi:hypothetical protein